MIKKLIFISILLFGSFCLIVYAPAFSGVIQDGEKTYIMDRHGERWDVTQTRPKRLLSPQDYPDIII